MISKVGLLWDSVSNNIGDKAIGLILERILTQYQIPFRPVNVFGDDLSDLHTLVIGGGELIREPYHPFYRVFRVQGTHILNTIGVTSGQETDYLKSYRLVTTRSQYDRSKIDYGTVTPCLTLLYGAYLPSNDQSPLIDKDSMGIHIMPDTVDNPLALITLLQKIKNTKIYWIPITYYSMDRNYMETLASHVPDSVVLPEMSPDDVFRTVGKFKAFITTSLHGTLFAYTQGVPFLASRLASKIVAFAEERNLSDCLFQTVEDLALKLPELMNTSPIISNDVKQDQANCQSLVRQITAHCVEALKSDRSIFQLNFADKHYHDLEMKYYQQMGLRSAQHLRYVLSQHLQVTRILDENQKLRNEIRRFSERDVIQSPEHNQLPEQQADPIIRSYTSPQQTSELYNHLKTHLDVDKPIPTPLQKHNHSSQRVQIIIPVPGNYFYRLTGQRVGEALRSLGKEVVICGLHNIDEGEFDRSIIIHPSEILHEFVNYQKSGDYNEVYQRLGQIRKHSRQFDMLLLECVQSKWFKESLEIFRAIGMDRIIDLGFHSQLLNLEPKDRNRYQFIFNGLTSSESEKLHAMKPANDHHSIPWIFVGISSPKRLNLIHMLSHYFDESGLVYMLEHPEPVRDYGPHISHENFRRIQQHTDFTVWCSHHDYFYLESERFREALLAGTLPIKVLYEPIPSNLKIPFNYLLTQVDMALATLRQIKDQYSDILQRFSSEFISLPHLNEELKKLFES